MTGPNTRRKQNARYLVRRALEDGTLVRMPCEVCGSTKSVAHHETYARPLEVMWLCRPHHIERHWEIGRPMGPRGPRKERPMPKIKWKKLLTPRQVAELMEVKPRTVTRWCREGRIHPCRKLGRVWRI